MKTITDLVIEHRNRLRELGMSPEVVQEISKLANLLCQFEHEHPESFAEYFQLDMNDPRDRKLARKLRGIREVK